MNASELNKLLEHPETLSEDSYEEMKKIIQEHPYFPLPYLVQALYQPTRETLEKVSIYTYDRNILTHKLGKRYNPDSFWEYSNINVDNLALMQKITSEQDVAKAVGVNSAKPKEKDLSVGEIANKKLSTPVNIESSGEQKDTGAGETNKANEAKVQVDEEPETDVHEYTFDISEYDEEKAQEVRDRVMHTLEESKRDRAHREHIQHLIETGAFFEPFLEQTDKETIEDLLSDQVDEVGNEDKEEEPREIVNNQTEQEVIETEETEETEEQTDKETIEDLLSDQVDEVGNEDKEEEPREIVNNQTEQEVIETEETEETEKNEAEEGSSYDEVHGLAQNLNEAHRGKNTEQSKTKPSEYEMFFPNTYLFEEDIMRKYENKLKAKQRKQKLIIDKFVKNKVEEKIVNKSIKSSDMPTLKRRSTPKNNEQLGNKESGSKKLGLPITEEVARLLSKQNKPQEAILIYNQLIEKHPEKKDYFLGIIQQLSNN